MTVRAAALGPLLSLSLVACGSQNTDSAGSAGGTTGTGGAGGAGGAGGSGAGDICADRTVPDVDPAGCNQSALLCARTVDNIVFPTTHNAMSSIDDGWIAPNQPHPIGSLH